jgi:hypothetical protein
MAFAFSMEIYKTLDRCVGISLNKGQYAITQFPLFLLYLYFMIF